VSHFEKINFLPVHNLYYEYKLLNLENKDGQICLNSTKDDPDNYLLGAGSLIKDWSDALSTEGRHTSKTPKIEYKEEDFTELCSIFKGTVFESVYIKIKQHFKIGRIRIMTSKPKTCLSWHYDLHKRLHYVMRTNEFGCYMIIEKEIQHLPHNTWWVTDTTKYHTAINASQNDRLHLVGTIL
tara:strand:+ start:8350 stop:8895 length:546 start_codon:yes stop_codon:yes gene_type:complete